MEKKKLNRVVGIVMVVAVMTIVFPFLTGKSSMFSHQEILSMEAPTFPGDNISNKNSEIKSNSIARVKIKEDLSQNPNASTVLAATSIQTTQAEAAPHPSIDNAKSQVPQADELKKKSEGDNYNHDAPLINPPDATAPSSIPEKPLATTTKLNADPEKKLETPPSNIETSEVRYSAAKIWAVQMGHFHNHSNAIRLANRLRSAGYKAFTRQIVSRNGNVSTRVYVGPETARASAKKVSNNIHSQLNLDGIVVYFKPLSL